MNAYPKARIKLDEVDAGVYKVQSCMVWFEEHVIRFLGSREKYESTDAAVAEMKRQTMDLLRERGRTETEHEVNWVIESE